MDHVLDRIEIQAEPFAICELRGRTDLGLGRQSQVMLHYILAGHGEVAIADHPAIPVSAGSMVLVPAFRSHALRCHGGGSMATPECRPAELNLQHHLVGSEGRNEGTLLALCTQIDIGLRRAHSLINLARDPIADVISDDPAKRQLMDRLVAEIAAPGLGSKAMVRALLLECMIHLLRSRIAAGDGAMDWMMVLGDSSLWQALEAMLDRPGEAHTVESLAAMAGMSRSTFARRFTDAYGRGPMVLLRRLRVRMAASLLAESDLPIKRIAQLTGFRSRSAFSRAFTDATRLSPREFRADERDG